MSAAKAATYGDGSPLDRITYLEAKLILKPDCSLPSKPSVISEGWCRNGQTNKRAWASSQMRNLA